MTSGFDKPIAAVMAIDILRARADTPSCAQITHFNNAGAALPPSSVTEAVISHLRREAAIGGYEAAAEAEPQIERAYDAVATLIGCARDEVAMIENATRAWDMAFYAQAFTPGDRILIGRCEYASNIIAMLQVARQTGVQIDIVPDDEHGQISIAALRRMLDARVRLIALTHAPSDNGLVNPAAQVGVVAREFGVPYLLDACQSIGQMPICVDDIGCDMLSATGRKYLRGPRGTGFLYMRRALIEQLTPPFLDQHAAKLTSPSTFEIRDDARRFENWESFVAGRIGLAVAVDYALGWGLDAIADRIAHLAGLLRDGLRMIPGVTVHDTGFLQSGIVTFTKNGENPAALQRRLKLRGINTSVAAPAPARIGAAGAAPLPVLRASVHYYNTGDEVDHLCSSVADA